jgi:hypothetical protein
MAVLRNSQLSMLASVLVPPSVAMASSLKMSDADTPNWRETVSFAPISTTMLSLEGRILDTLAWTSVQVFDPSVEQHNQDVGLISCLLYSVG